MATAMYATRCTASSPVRTTPSLLVYGWDMIMIMMDVLLIANLAAKKMTDSRWSTRIRQSKKRKE